jgi:hypothetical protein
MTLILECSCVSRSLVCCLGFCLLAACWPQQAALGQEDLIVEEGPLVDQQPFDLIHLTAEAGGGAYKVFPIAFPGRQLPDKPAPSAKIEVVFTKFPDRRYSIAWKSIDRIELYEDMVLREAKQRLAEKDMIGAFQNLSFLIKNYSQTPRLDELRHEFLFSSLAVSFRNKQLEQTLSTLEELKRSAPDYRPEEVARALNNVSARLLDQHQQRGDYDAVMKMLRRLRESHGDLEAVVAVEARLRGLAQAKQKEAEDHLRAKRYREAYVAAHACLSLDADSKPSRQLLEEMARIHPMIRVGVMQLSSHPDPSSLGNWAARRSGLLVYQPVFQFLKTGNEGGDYAFALGKFRLSDDRQSLGLTLDPRRTQNWDALQLGQLILQRSDPDHLDYDPLWASIFESVQVQGASQLEVRLQQPHVLPHAYMQWTLTDPASDSGWLPGPYQRTSIDGREAVYSLRPQSRESGQPLEVVEILYGSAQHAIYDLSRGYIDMIDQVFPADARSLASNNRYQVDSFLLPSTHLLIPVSDHSFLNQERFRRALLYATDRESILREELLGSPDPRDGRLVSGPFPLGNSDTDPLAYAYNRDIPPVAYNPQLAKVLVTTVQQDFDREAHKLGNRPPELEKLIVGCPDFEFAKVAVQALIQQWAIIGLEAEMLVLSVDTDPKVAELCDLIYITTTMWEPAADIQRLLGGNGITASDNPFVVQGLVRVREAKNWREVRTALQDLHRVVAYHLPVIPLWQVTDRYVVRRGIQGVEKQPVSLYQDIAKWRLPMTSPSSN